MTEAAEGPTRYLVESYLPRAQFEAAREAARRARLAAEQLAREGMAIAYLRMTFRRFV